MTDHRLTSSRSWVIPVLAAVLLIGATGSALAQGTSATDDTSYRIGPGDVLRLNVPAEPDLERELTVQPDSTVYVAYVGKVQVGGLTVAAAEEILTQRLRLFDTNIDTVILFVTQYNALRVFVLGAVSTPGAFTFSVQPSLWDVLRAAGGPLTEANLAAARIITQVDGRSASRTVNLSGYYTGDELPPIQLRSGDTLVVPSVADGAVGIPAEDGVQVFGGVFQPTTVPLSEPTPLLTVLMLAGSPAENAKLHQIDWVHRDPSSPSGVVSRRVDLTRFLREGQVVGNPVVYPGDVLYVGQRQPGWVQANLPLILATVTTLTTVLLAMDRLNP